MTRKKSGQTKKVSGEARWTFAGMYKSPTDPQVEKDVAKVERAYNSFARKYGRDKKFLTSAKVLAAALEDFERPLPKPVYYLSLYLAIHSNDHTVQGLLNRYSARLTKAGNKVLFFTVSLSKLDKKQQKKFLQSPQLKKFKYWLVKVFQQGQYTLPEAQEKILSLKDQTSYSAWVDMNEKFLNEQTVKYRGQAIPLSQAFELIASLPTRARYSLHRKVMTKLKQMSHLSEAELNAIVTDKKIDDELRGFQTPYAETLLSYQNDERELQGLRQVVMENFKVSHDFYNLKKKLLGLEALGYADRATPIGKLQKKFSLREARATVEQAYDEMDTEFGDVVRKLFADGRVDTHPRQYKSGGAFQAGGGSVPTHVLLNHTDDFNSLQTIAHEFGHATHTELARSQPPIYEGYPISAAEVASTFFEQVVFAKIFASLSQSEKIIALHDKIQRSISTIFRQIAVFNFELELHERVRADGFVPKEEIAKMMNKQMASYLGKAVRLEDLDGYFYVAWSHIRRYFYVYSYAYGEIISQAMFAKYQVDADYLHKVKAFLSAGGSDTPHNIFKLAGIDTHSEALWQAGIDNIKADIKLLKKLTK